MNTNYKTKTKPAFVIGEIAHYYRCTIEQLSEKIGAGRSSQLYSIANGRTATMSRKYAKMICDTFPELNYDWVLTGEGSMFCRDESTLEETYQQPTSQNPDYSGVLLNILNTITVLHQEVSRLSKEIVQLRSTVTVQSQRIDTLVDELSLSRSSLRTPPGIDPSSLFHRESSPYRDIALADNSEINNK